MKNLRNFLGIAAVLVFAASMASTASAKSDTWTGWISDSACGAKGANAGAKDCTARCVKQQGASYVFVDSKTQKVVAIHNQDAVNPDEALGHEVTVTGDVQKDGSIHIEKIEPAEAK
ncbi:MAG TPA: hypothetical protein VJN21_15375 [Candidatus Acidoferrales bacterium]|nr:hypothetical protein [Candidatus Acidoferrales bacterium]